MKKILFSLFFFSLMIVGAQAQKSSCAKTCTKSAAASAACKDKAPGSNTASVATIENSAAAAKLASMDASIESRTDAATGNVTYVKKETCSHSGKVSFVDVSYDASTNTFLNVSPMKAAGTGVGCGSHTKGTATSGKACCASGASAGKSCCASKGAAAKTTEKVKS